jgi:hypothetical protein
MWWRSSIAALAAFVRFISGSGYRWLGSSYFDLRIRV